MIAATIGGPFVKALDPPYIEASVKMDCREKGAKIAKK